MHKSLTNSIEIWRTKIYTARILEGVMIEAHRRTEMKCIFVVITTKN